MLSKSPSAKSTGLGRFFWSALIVLATPALSVFAQGLSGTNAPKFLGHQSCGSSGCHGGAKDHFNQNIVWEKHDFHTRAYATLTTARSAQLARALQIADPAQSPRCTTCHAPTQQIPAGQRVEAMKMIQGISCEHCHGPAEPWLRTHTRADLTHEEKTTAGMRDLRNYYTRANTCVACHQNVEPDLLRAGHPELLFELDGQCVTEPRHWRERREDYGPALWLTGQAVALREMSWALGQQEQPLGRELERWTALRWLMGRLEPSLANIKSNPAQADFSAAQRGADQLARSAAQAAWSIERVQMTLVNLAGVAADFADNSTGPSIQARRAERLVLALDRLTMALPENHAAAQAQPELKALFRAAQSVPDFNPVQFGKLLQNFQKKLTGSAAPSAQP